jgi:hypothetical protein
MKGVQIMGVIVPIYSLNKLLKEHNIQFVPRSLLEIFDAMDVTLCTCDSIEYYYGNKDIDKVRKYIKTCHMYIKIQADIERIE